MVRRVATIPTCRFRCNGDRYDRCAASQLMLVLHRMSYRPCLQRLRAVQLATHPMLYRVCTASSELMFDGLDSPMRGSCQQHAQCMVPRAGAAGFRNLAAIEAAPKPDRSLSFGPEAWDAWHIFGGCYPLADTVCRQAPAGLGARDRSTADSQHVLLKLSCQFAVHELLQVSCFIACRTQC
jgi:hypothetical protein